MGANAVKGIITFALGGVILLFAIGLLQTIFNNNPGGPANIATVAFLAFVGFLFLGIGIWGILQDTVGNKAN